MSTGAFWFMKFYWNLKFGLKNSLKYCVRAVLSVIPAEELVITLLQRP